MAMKKTTKTLKPLVTKDEPLAAHEYEWTEKVYEVPEEGFALLSFPELRLFAAMLGLDPEEQKDKTHSALVRTVYTTVLEDTVRAQRAYDMIVLQLPEPETVVPRNGHFASDDFWPAYQRVINKTKQDLSTQVLGDMVASTSVKITESMQEYIKAEASKLRRLEVVLPDGKTTKPEGVLHAQFDLAVQLLSQDLPILLVGPTQCGKTTLVAQLAKALKLNFAAQSFSGGLTESKLLGRVLPKKGGAAEFVGTPFLNVFENGGLFLADEIDAGDSNVLTSLNMGIANGEIWLPDRDGKPVAKKSNKFRLAAAANTFGFGADSRYVGRNALDYATLERFGCGVIYMDYDQRIEASLARTEICDWAWNLRERIRRTQLNREMSTRTIKVLEKMTAAYGWTRKEWEERLFSNWSKEERRLLAA